MFLYLFNLNPLHNENKFSLLPIITRLLKNNNKIWIPNKMLIIYLSFPQTQFCGFVLYHMQLLIFNDMRF